MSKSLGNGIDPLEIVEEYGADSLRFTILYLSPVAQRIRLSKDSFDMGSRFANKLWNASRLILSNAGTIKPGKPEEAELNDWDQWILDSLEETRQKMEENLLSYRFNDLTAEIYHFIWSRFCDWYLEVSKTRLYKGTEKEKKTVIAVLLHVLDQALRLLHPVMPFVTEEIWQKLPGREGETIMKAAYPKPDGKRYAAAVENIDILQEAIYLIRNIRGDMGITPDQKLSVILSSPDAGLRALLEKYRKEITSLAKCKEVEVLDVKEKPEKTVSAVGKGFEVFVRLEGIIDFEKEVARLEKEIQKTEQDLGKVEKKLNNPQFLEKAPDDVIEKERDKKDEMSEKLEKIHQLLKNLKNQKG
jgi:valyl-tRNA synthetase